MYRKTKSKVKHSKTKNKVKQSKMQYKEKCKEKQNAKKSKTPRKAKRKAMQNAKQMVCFCCCKVLMKIFFQRKVILQGAYDSISVSNPNSIPIMIQCCIIMVLNQMVISNIANHLCQYSGPGMTKFVEEVDQYQLQNCRDCGQERQEPHQKSCCLMCLVFN